MQITPYVITYFFKIINFNSSGIRNLFGVWIQQYLLYFFGKTLRNSSLNLANFQLALWERIWLSTSTLRLEDFVPFFWNFKHISSQIFSQDGENFNLLLQDMIF